MRTGEVVSYPAEAVLDITLAEFYKTENEQLHIALFGLHDDLFRKALTRVKDALLVLHGLEVRNMDVRDKCRVYIAEFELLREKLESLGWDAAELRGRIIEENGCSGICHK